MLTNIKNKVDLLNVCLIPICGALAYYFPLEVFILSLCILGPLHYLTEINWLSSKEYFSKNLQSKWLIIGLATSLILVVPRIYFEFFGTSSSSYLTSLLKEINHWSNGAIFICLSLAAGSLFISKKSSWIILITFSLIVAYLLNGLETYTILIGVLVPTIIHVYVFTLLFMLYGSKKSKSKLGFLSVILAIAVPLVIMVVPINPSNYLFHSFFKEAFIDNRLHVAPVMFSKILGFSEGTSFFFYEDLELRLIMFLSFIYLYHYLNWFSKTSTIFWHKSLTLKRTTLIALFWIFQLVLFYIDFKIGFLFSLFFSFLHVILEFPLNATSIKSLFLKK